MHAPLQAADRHCRHHVYGKGIADREHGVQIRKVEF